MLTDILKTLGDLNRLRILNLLNHYGEICNCDIEDGLELNQSNVSRHLNKLKINKIINARKVAKWTYYSLNKEILEKYSFVKDVISSLNTDDEIYKNDLEKVAKIIAKKKECN